MGDSVYSVMPCLKDSLVKAVTVHTRDIPLTKGWYSKLAEISRPERAVRATMSVVFSNRRFLHFTSFSLTTHDALHILTTQVFVLFKLLARIDLTFVRTQTFLPGTRTLPQTTNKRPLQLCTAPLLSRGEPSFYSLLLDLVRNFAYVNSVLSRAEPD
jgi:hypothetical protein